MSLPSYEEAVYSSWGQRLPTSLNPGPTQLLLAQESPSSQQASRADGSQQPLLSSQNADNPPPPPYEEVQSSHSRDRTAEGDIRELRLPLTEDKDAR